ncbi:pyruvate formate-lyase 1-activating enzyme [Solitalea longa]|uniref:Pyruvate formate-lyase-activating enzyme n=1 Tax=Solitalea longa TaxID=2079460 RepID=A0A2S4ZX91_9SPHI|nr:pyruvate formate-lyase-activating protein [Solitalea longa]POY34984.1 pyruvate formate-lyase 1-activating enzyme [Solitalea longa]
MYLPFQEIEAEELNDKDPEFIRIHSLETFGTHDGPGIRMVVFAQGCQFRCLYCQNADTLDVRGGQLVQIDELVERAKRQIGYFGTDGGVTVSGGEPLLQRSKLITFFKRLHDEGINTCLDTNGRLLDDQVKELLTHTDLILLDVKHINEEWHRKLTGVSNKPTLQVAAYCESIGLPMWLRYVLVPGWSDQPEYVEEWGKHFTDYKCIQRVEILPYHKLGTHKWEMLGMDYGLPGVEAPSAEIKKRTLDIFKKYFENVQLR